MLQRMLMVLTVSFVALAVAQPEPSAMLFAGIATLALAAILAARYAAIGIRAPELTIGARSRQHREALSALPEPQHPRTAGRRRSRAPSQSPAAA